MMRRQARALADDAFAWLWRCQRNASGYDQGGIMDALDGRVVGDHYATTHFAWGCALRHAAGPDPRLLEAARLAVAFHLRTSPDEYPPGNWAYHWDFNNLAFAETVGLLDSSLSEPVRTAWRAGLDAWKTNPHWAVNWVAMRALAHFRRYDLLGRPEDLALAEKWLAYVLDAQMGDGGIWDIKGKSLPSQYHAYTACLLHRMRPRHPGVAKAVGRAARWLLALTPSGGEMNALGRGQKQLFGYACAVYLFLAAIDLDPELAPNYRWAARAVLKRLADFQTSDGWWPLVFNRLPVEQRAGWYDYHHLSVYNAFAAVWLTLAAGLDDGSDSPAQGEALLESPAIGTVWLKDSGLLAVRRKHWFALFSAGCQGDGYATEAGITPHHIEWQGHELFCGPLGPGPGKYGARAAGQGQEANVWAPMWRAEDGSWHAPSGAAGVLRSDGKAEKTEKPGRWLLDLSVGDAIWRRELLLGRRFLEARDILTAPDASSGSAVRVQNYALLADRPRESGGAFVRDIDSGAVLRVWGGDPLEQAGSLDVPAGRVDILASSGASGAPSGWRLRQGPGEEGGKLPGVVCLTWDPWSPLWKRKQRLLFEMASQGRTPKTLYVEPATSATQIVENIGGVLGGGLPGATGERYRRCLAGRTKDMGHGFHVASPVLPWPGQRTFPGLERANRKAWLGQLRRLVRRMEFEDGYVLWLYHPSQVDALDALGDEAELVVYDWTDDWVAALPPDRSAEERRTLEARQRELLSRVDVVFAVSTALAQRAGQWCPHVHHLPNATDPEIFKPHDPVSPSHPLAVSRPLLVYLSQITERLDVDLVLAMAKARPHWTVALIGPVVCAADHVAPLERLANVVLVGALPYEEAAALTAQADVCLLPHTEDALTRTLDPIKLYDYLATGRPIVSTAVAMHPDLAGQVNVASGAEAFITAVEQALGEAPAAGAQRLLAARAHTWSARARQAATVLEHFFPED